MPPIDQTLRRAAVNVGLPFFAAAITSFYVVASLRHGTLGFDMMTGLLPLAERIVDGASILAVSTYPPLVPFLLVPITFVPGPATVLAALALACVPASLWALGVRDWRCYVAALVWGPVQAGIRTANPTLFLLLACALAWRYRSVAVAAAASTGLAIAAKAISAPFVVWLLATRRLRTGAASVIVAAGITGVLVGVDRLALGGGSGAWAIRTVPGSSSTPSYGIADVVRALGWSTEVGLVALAVAVGAMVALTARYGRRGEDAHSFAAAAVATLLIAPNVWLHSFSFVLLAVAVLRPRLSPVWIAPALLLLVPVPEPTWRETIFTWAVIAAVVTAVLRGPAPGGDPREDRAADGAQTGYASGSGMISPPAMRQAASSPVRTV